MFILPLALKVGDRNSTCNNLDELKVILVIFPSILPFIEGKPL